MILNFLEVLVTITVYPIGRPVRATITLYPIGRPARATITLYPIGRSVRATYYYTVSYIRSYITALNAKLID